MTMELSHRNWKLLFGDGARRCQLSIAAGALDDGGDRLAVVAVSAGQSAQPTVSGAFCRWW